MSSHHSDFLYNTKPYNISASVKVSVHDSSQYIEQAFSLKKSRFSYRGKVTE